MKIRACPMWLGAYNVGPQIKIFKLNYPGSKLAELPDELFSRGHMAKFNFVFFF